MPKQANSMGMRIKMRREELGMSQEQLAKKVGYNGRSTINRIEHDERKLNQDKIVLMANVLKVTPAYLMGWLPDDDVVGSPTPFFDSLQPTEQAIMERVQYLNTGNQMAVLTIINQLIDAQIEENK